jgi:hypothetical protein
METINGYVVIAQAPINGGNLRHGERVLLAVRDLSPAYMGYEYVVAGGPTRESFERTETVPWWSEGHYMRDSLAPGAVPAVVRAVAEFQARAGLTSIPTPS